MDSSPSFAVAAPPRNRRRFVLAATVFVFLTLALVVAFLDVGRWLVVEDPIDKARAIVVLNGGMPVRALEAAKLYRQG